MSSLGWGHVYITEELILGGKAGGEFLGGSAWSSHCRWLGWAQVELAGRYEPWRCGWGGMSVWQNDGQQRAQS